MLKAKNKLMRVPKSDKDFDALLLLRNKTAIVTGAAQGFGAAIAIRLAEAGAFVVVADCNQQGAKSKSDEINSKGYGFCCCYCCYFFI